MSEVLKKIKMNIGNLTIYEHNICLIEIAGVDIVTDLDVKKSNI